VTLVSYSFEAALALGIALHVTLFILPVIISLVIVTTERIGIAVLIRNLRQVTWAGREQ